MKTSKTPTVSALAAFRAAEEAQAAAASRHAAVRAAADRARGSGRMLPEDRLAVCEAEASMLEADDARSAARSLASAELAARDVADPAERSAAEGCDLARLLGDYDALQADVERASEAHRAAILARNTRVLDANAAHGRLIEIRGAQGLPPPVTIPPFTDEVAFASALRAIVDAGGVVVAQPNYLGRIYSLRAEAVEIRARLEAERLNELEHAAGVAAVRAERQEDFQARARSRAAENATIDAANAAVRTKIEALAAAHLARTSAP